MPPRYFDGKAAVVNGSGTACARLLAAGGARVVVADLHEGSAKLGADEIGSKAVAFAVDVPDPQACEDGGSMVNMASILGSVGFAGSAAYVAAMHGLVGLAKTAALEDAAQGIRVSDGGYTAR